MKDDDNSKLVGIMLIIFCAIVAITIMAAAGVESCTTTNGIC